MPSYNYDDDYATCVETYSTLRIFSDDLSPGDIANRLTLQPTSVVHKRPRTAKQAPRKNGWFFSTQGRLTSKDSRRHLDEILDAIEPSRDAIRALIEAGCQIDISSYWLSIGQGGPTIEHEQMDRLAHLKIGVWWDIYFHDGDDDVAQS